MFALHSSTNRIIPSTSIKPFSKQWICTCTSLHRLCGSCAFAHLSRTPPIQSSISELDLSETLDNAMELHGSRNLVFACDDSLAAEKGARFLMERFARPGDIVHFVHVISDNRSPFLSVGEVSCDTDNVFTFSSIDVNDAFPLQERQQYLIEQGEQMMKRRFSKMINQMPSIEARFHLPILSRPESASEIASVVCDLAAELKADALVIVSPSSGVFFSYGSVGFHCYQQTTVPVIFLPAPVIPSKPLEEKNMILLLAKTEAEQRWAVQWTKGHIAHVFKSDKFYVVCIDKVCSCEIPETTRTLEKQLEKGSEMLRPMFAVMYFSDEYSILEQLKVVPFVESCYEENRFPIVLLPRLHPHNHLPDSYWSDFAYNSQDMLQI